MLRWYLQHRLPRDRDPGVAQVHGVIVPSWECNVCGRRRPDDRIVVYTAYYDLLTGDRALNVLPDGVVTVHVRYCVDQPTCRAGAPRKAREWTTVLRESKRNRDAVRRVLDR